MEKILLIGSENDQIAKVITSLEGQFEVCQVASTEETLQKLQHENYAAIFFGQHEPDIISLSLEVGGLLERLPNGVVLLNAESTILWSNLRMQEMVKIEESILGQNFYDVFNSPEIIGPDFGPFQTVLGTGEPTRSVLRIEERTYFEIHVQPLDIDPEQNLPNSLIVTVRDISIDVLQRHKLSAIYQAGLELGSLSPQDVLEMTVEDRIELLKSKILYYTQDLMEFETIEIRLVDKVTKKLVPLLAVGMIPDATDRELYAEPQNNGVTGFVASTGKSYLCEDTESDPLYILGAQGARSSLTVPLVLHDDILGTFNVESPHPGAFSEDDLQFLELFSRELALALNTLELLVVEKVTTATLSAEFISRKASNHVDEILNDAAWILEKYIGHDPDVCERLQRVLSHTRRIRKVISQAGDPMTPTGSHAPILRRQQHPQLQGKRILCVDADESVRRAAHELLGRNGCDVETAHNGEEALLMTRRFEYDVAMIDIRLPDLGGYECFMKLKEIRQEMPVILMTGFGYDPSHAVVKARQEGLKSVLYKPFRLDQLLEELEKNFEEGEES